MVAAGADPNVIRLAAEGAEKLKLDARGDLVLHASHDQVRFRKPLIYQEVAGERRLIAGGYTLRGSGQVGFQLASYDRSEPLTIDPASRS